jgi:hypothetical protein
MLLHKLAFYIDADATVMNRSTNKSFNLPIKAAKAILLES